MPAPNATLGALSVPGAAPAPMLRVPTAPAFVAITTNPPALTMPPSAIVSDAPARIADVDPKLIAPGRVRAGHGHRPLRAGSNADVGIGRGGIDDRPTVCDRKRARAKAADIEPADWTVLFHVEPWPVTVTVPVARAIRRSRRRHCLPYRRFGWSACPCPRRRPRWSEVFVHVESGPVTVTAPCEPGALPIAPKTLFNVPPFWMISVPELPADDPRFMCWFR